MAKRNKPASGKAKAAVTAPPFETAQTELLRLTLRAWVMLGIRIVAVGLLTALLTAQSPWLRTHRLILDMASGVLVLAPFFTAMGRSYAWRIALGRTYVREARWEDANYALTVFTTPRARLFDAGSEGLYNLALARRALGQDDSARRLFETVAAQGRAPLREQARAALVGSRA